MNEVIRTLGNHRSIRRYKPDKLEDAYLEAILGAAMSAPNWINGQQVTVIEVRDKAVKDQLSEAAGNQAHVREAPVLLVFCIDFSRAWAAAEKQGVEFAIINDIEAVLIGGTDVGLAMGNAIAAAESLGLGIVPIGGLRRDPQRVIDLLELPKYVFPVAGLLVGFPDEEPSIKPRFPLKAVHHKEKYNPDSKDMMDQYDETMSQYMKERTQGASSSSWSERTAVFYSEGFRPYGNNVKPALKRQGFGLGEEGGQND